MGENKSKDRTAALVGGAALLALLFSRGRGLGFRGPGDGRTNGGPRKRRTVWIRANGIELDGKPSDLATVISKAREAGEVEVHATGDAITRVVREVLTALHAANVAIFVAPDLAYIVPAEVIR